MNRKGYYSIGVLLLIVLAGWMAQPVQAQTDQELLKEMQKQLQSLQSRVSELESTNSSLKERLQQQEKSVQTQAQKVEEIEKTSDAGKKPAIRSSFNTELYGYLKFDTSYDTSRTSVGNFARWAESDALSNDDDQFNATANQSRFGLKFDGPDVGGANTSGRVEVDFYGAGAAENKAHIMMRHAYLQMDWPELDLSLLAGQTSDVVAPLVPTTVNYTVGWWSGDIGYRRPQFRLTKGFDLTEDTKLTLQGAFTRTIGDSLFGMSGEDSGFPTMQGRMALSFPLLTEAPTTIGLSGHWGQEEVDLDRLDNADDVDTWSAVLDLTVPLAEKLKLTGEAWMGENLDAYLGGIGYGVHGFDRDANPNTGNNGFESFEGVDAKGGWGALAIGPWGNFSYNLGAAIDDPDGDELNNGQRDQNMTVFGNVFWKINEAILTGFEVSYLDTEYKNQADGDSMRFQAALIYKF